MKIAESAIQFASSHTAVEYSERQESLTVWQQGKEPVRTDRANQQDKTMEAKAMALTELAVKVSLSVEAQQKVSEQGQAEPVSEEDSLLADLNLQILRALFEKLTGRKMKIFNPGAGGQEAASPEIPSLVKRNRPAQAGEGWGVRYESHKTNYEYETSRFSAQGVVLTSDGQKIDIAVVLNLSRSSTITLDESFRAGADLKDPLVVNFDGTAAQLTQDTFSFDINADGSNENISFVAPGSGFLTLDANNDGIVNDGSELFGALSGDGFAELAAYDSDKNGWIDENDAVYSRLRIWTKTAVGADQLITLAEKGIGALYLGRVATPFAIKDSNNELLGQVRSTGIFLREEGGTGTLQQIDLVA